MKTFAKQVVLVTGGGAGIGLEVSRILAAEGAVVAIIDLDPKHIEELSSKFPPNTAVVGVTGDVCNRESLQSAVAKLEEKVGPIDLLIANAGVGFETSALRFQADEFEKLIHVNLVGVSNSIGAVLPGMLSRGRGHLAAISSLASYRGLPRMAAYCASKAGVNALMDAFRVELAPLGISVTTICPGWIRTRMTEDINVDTEGILGVDEAAGEIVGAIRSRRTFHAFPRSSVWRLNVIRWLPHGIADWLIRRKLRELEKKKEGM